MNDLSLDIETMGTTPGSAVVGIGACFFDTNTGEMSEKFYRAVNLASACRVGMTMDPGTVIWWLQQDDAARQALYFNTVTLESALQDFSDWVNELCPDGNARPWMRGPSFDGSLLQAAYRCVGKQAPWHFVNERCHRTLTARNPSVEPPVREGTYHNAADDAVFQALWLIKIAAYQRARKTQ